MIRNALKSADFPQFSDRYDTGALRHSGTPNAHNGMLILVLSHPQFPHAVLRAGEAVPQYWNQGNVPVLRNEREGTESNGAVRKCSVIANQRARWCGNPPDFQTSWQQNQAVSIQPGGCHTSDVGHWFAATYFSNSSNILLRKKSILLTPRPWWRQCPRRFRRRWQAAHRRSPPGPWPPPASAPRRRQRSFPWGYPGRSCS